MAVNKLGHVNECGLPLNAIRWLETHHESKLTERQLMIEDLSLEQGCFVVDAGCGPGLWSPLLAQAIGPKGRILGIDISPEALVTAQRRSAASKYHHQVSYKKAALEKLPLARASVDVIFSANVSQYLANPVETFAAMGPYLQPQGRLIVKDIDFGTLRFYNIDTALQSRVFRARERWETERVHHGYSFEDSWVGSRLASYLRSAGFTNVQEQTYKIVRRFPVPDNFRFYLQGIAEWFVSEGAPYLTQEDVTNWLQCFSPEQSNVFDSETFAYEETEYVVSGIWNSTPSLHYYDLHISLPTREQQVLVPALD